MRFVAGATLIGLVLGLLAVTFLGPRDDGFFSAIAPGFVAREGAPDYDEGDFQMPVAGVGPRDIRDSFRAGRPGGRIHHAIDIFAARGTPVVAATDGEVVRLGVDGLGGNVLRIRTPSGRYEMYYAHLDRFRPGLRQGMAVQAGDTLGTVGTTGNARRTPPHLHFQLLLRRRGGEATPLNPYPLLRFRPSQARREPVETERAPGAR